MKRAAGARLDAPTGPDDDAARAAPSAGAAAAAATRPDEEDELVFEDPYEDEEEDSDASDADEDVDGGDDDAKPAPAVTGSGKDADDDKMDEDDDDDEDGEDAAAPLPVVWRPGLPSNASAAQREAANAAAVAAPLASAAADDDAEMEVEIEAYVMLHELSVEWPCLSFDVLRDTHGPARTRFPLSAYIVAGTQAATPSDNKLLVMRMSSLHRTQHDAKESSDDEDELADNESDCDDDAELDVQRIPHRGGVNRVRVMPQEPHIVASMSDLGPVCLWDVRPQTRVMEAHAGAAVAAAPVPKGYGPVYTFRGHRTEGYAMDWSGTVPGRLVTGDCDGAIHVWDCDAEAASNALASSSSGVTSSLAGSSTLDLQGVWKVNPDKPYVSHAGSVEDLQWSPSEATVFASAGVDGSIRIWDTRARSSMLSVQAAAVDVNAISWSKLVSFFLASGDESGALRVWDLRRFDADAAVSTFTWHKKAIYSVEWAYDDENVIAVASADNTCTLWDMSLEHDDEAEIALARAQAAASGSRVASGLLPSSRDPTLADIPPQLLFIHGVRSQLKEVHFHPQLPGVMITTSADGFSIFKPDVVMTT